MYSLNSLNASQKIADQKPSISLIARSALTKPNPESKSGCTTQSRWRRSRDRIEWDSACHAR
jgi:hypothetical protein